VTDFVSVLMEMRNGEVAMDCNRKFNDVLSSVFETGAKGTLTLTVSVKPSKFAMGGAVVEVETEHTCRIKKPELNIGRTLFFVGKDGTLNRDDPMQLALLHEEQVRMEIRSDGQ